MIFLFQEPFADRQDDSIFIPFYRNITQRWLFTNSSGKDFGFSRFLFPRKSETGGKVHVYPILHRWHCQGISLNLKDWKWFRLKLFCAKLMRLIAIITCFPWREKAFARAKTARVVRSRRKILGRQREGLSRSQPEALAFLRTISQINKLLCTCRKKCYKKQSPGMNHTNATLKQVIVSYAKPLFNVTEKCINVFFVPDV